MLSKGLNWQVFELCEVMFVLTVFLAHCIQHEAQAVGTQLFPMLAIQQLVVTCV